MHTDINALLKLEEISFNYYRKFLSISTFVFIGGLLLILISIGMSEPRQKKYIHSTTIVRSGPFKTVDTYSGHRISDKVQIKIAGGVLLFSGTLLLLYSLPSYLHIK